MTLQHRRDGAATAAVRVSASEYSPSGLWNAIATSDGFQDALVESVRDLLAGRLHHERVGALYDAGVTAINGGYARFVAGLDRGPETEAYQSALELTAGIGQDGMTALGHVPLSAVADGPVAVLEAADSEPTVAVRVDQAFRDRPRQERERICQLLAMLGQACEVFICATGMTARWLVDTHRNALPASFSETIAARHQPDTPVAELVEAARAGLDADDPSVEMLREIADAPVERLDRAALQDRLDVSSGRITQHKHTLEEYDLIATVGSRSAQSFKLLPAGSAFLDALDADQAKQLQLDASFSDTRQTHHRPCNHARTRGGEGTGDTTDGTATAHRPYRTAFLSRSHHVAAVEAAAGGVTTVETPTLASSVANVEDEEHLRWVSYDDVAEEAVIAVTATSALQSVTSTATALASREFIDAALSRARLDDIELPAAVLRGARCIGALSDDAAANSNAFRESLIEWGDRIEDMTTDLHNGEYEDRDSLRATIMQSAHGLAGTIVHLLDVLDIDYSWELRLPEHLPDKTLAEIAETVSLATTIQSRYGHHTVQRALFETRPDKVDQMLSLSWDPADPLGECIAGLVVRGRRADRFGQHLQGRLRARSPRDDVHDIAVDIPVTTADRDHYTAAIGRLLETKQIAPTPAAVTLLQSLTADIYSAVEAVHWLDREDDARHIRLDEVRAGLAALDPAQLLPAHPSSVGQLVAALLRSEGALSQTELAGAAGVSTRTVSRRIGALVAADLVRETEDGYRFSLPHSDERGDEIKPGPTESTSPQDTLLEVALAVVDPARVSDPDDAVGKGLTWPYDWGQLRSCTALQPWVTLVLSLADQPETADAVDSVKVGVTHGDLTAGTAGGVPADD